MGQVGDHWTVAYSIAVYAFIVNLFVVTSSALQCRPSLRLERKKHRDKSGNDEQATRNVDWRRGRDASIKRNDWCLSIINSRR